LGHAIVFQPAAQTVFCLKNADNTARCDVLAFRDYLNIGEKSLGARETNKQGFVYLHLLGDPRAADVRSGE
jgi:hypothetical protein